jgi:hypothetical protein
MNYTKPEVAILGEASCVIQGLKNPRGTLDGIPPYFHVMAAYDLDE